MNEMKYPTKNNKRITDIVTIAFDRLRSKSGVNKIEVKSHHIQHTIE